VPTEAVEALAEILWANEAVDDGSLTWGEADEFAKTETRAAANYYLEVALPALRAGWEREMRERLEELERWGFGRNNVWEPLPDRGDWIPRADVLAALSAPEVEGREPNDDEWFCDTCGLVAPAESECWEQTPQDDAGVTVERCPACRFPDQEVEADSSVEPDLDYASLPKFTTREPQMPEGTVTVVLPAPVAQAAVMALSKGRWPIDEQREGRSRIKQALLDAGWRVDSDPPAHPASKDQGPESEGADRG
jgi:hypothetical protein